MHVREEVLKSYTHTIYYKLKKRIYFSLTNLCLVDSPILLNWVNLFPKFWMSSIFISIFRIFLTEIHLSKQRRPRWDAALCGVSSGSTLFAMSFFQDARHKWVKFGYFVKHETDHLVQTIVRKMKHNFPKIPVTYKNLITKNKI